MASLYNFFLFSLYLSSILFLSLLSFSLALKKNIYIYTCV